jgi:hypothetical protein
MAIWWQFDIFSPVLIGILNKEKSGNPATNGLHHFHPAHVTWAQLLKQNSVSELAKPDLSALVCVKEVKNVLFLNDPAYAGLCKFVDRFYFRNRPWVSGTLAEQMTKHPTCDNARPEVGFS